MNVIFLPVYIQYIGIEAFGIIGFFVALQAFFTILDMGLSASLNRELARRSSATLDPDSTRDLVRTLEWICWPTGVLIALVVWAASEPIAQHWLQPVSMSVEQTAGALLLLGLSTALQWPVSFYSGGLAGLQRQVLLNALSAAYSTIRAIGAVCVLWLVAPTIDAFLWWNVGVSAAQGLGFALVIWLALPKGSRAPSFRFRQLKEVGGFAIGMTGVTILSFLLTQTDRIVLSKILTLNDFGVYAFAASLAFSLLRLVQPIVTAAYPRYSQLIAALDTGSLIEFYHHTNQAMSATVLPIAVVVAAFAGDLLRLWTGDAALSAASAPILSLLVLGSSLNGLMNLPYTLQLAYGWTRLALWINVVSVCLVVPGIWILGEQFGGVGAASVWLALNLGYVTIGIPLMHRRLLRGEMARWYTMDILPPLAASLVVGLAWRIAIPRIQDGAIGWALLLAVMMTTLAASSAVSSFPRRTLMTWWRKLRGHTNDR